MEAIWRRLKDFNLKLLQELVVHMTLIPELLDGTTCLVLSIFVYLSNSEKLMTTRIGSFKSPKTTIPVLVVPGLKVYLISCARICANLGCQIVLNRTQG